jgi:hypothetical protein
MPLAVDDDDGDLALPLAGRIAGAEMRPEGPITFASFGLCTQILFGPGSRPRVSISER